MSSLAQAGGFDVDSCSDMWCNGAAKGCFYDPVCSETTNCIDGCGEVEGVANYTCQAECAVQNYDQYNVLVNLLVCNTGCLSGYMTNSSSNSTSTA